MKHVKSVNPNPEVLIHGSKPRVEEVIFEAIDANAIQNAAKNIHGSGGPTKVDADSWKHVLCSKSFGKLSEELADEIAIATRRFCVEDIPHNYTNLLFDCRLVPLMKEDNGVRPIGIGETLRRIVGKSVTKVVRSDVQLAGGCLQTCTGVEAGIESSIHAMLRLFQSEDCEAVILVDADNAFNRLNRKATLHNVARICPPLSCFLENSYKEPCKLHLSDGTYIMSEEGATQGDPLAMPKYAVGTRPIIDSLKENAPDTAQAWFADDASACGLLEKLWIWWEHLNKIGPSYGYFPKPSKTFIVVKNPELIEKAKELFGKDVKITADGHRHIGAALGSEAFKLNFITKKVEKWVQDVQDLVKIAKEEPQAALSAFNVGMSQRWTFVQRTVQGISALFQPLEDAIRDQLIPTLCGKHVSDILPYSV